MQKNQIQSCITSVRMPMDFRDKVEEIAQENFLSFSDFTRIALLEQVKLHQKNHDSKWSLSK